MIIHRTTTSHTRSVTTYVYLGNDDDGDDTTTTINKTLAYAHEYAHMHDVGRYVLSCVSRSTGFPRPHSMMKKKKKEKKLNVSYCTMFHYTLISLYFAFVKLLSKILYFRSNKKDRRIYGTIDRSRSYRLDKQIYRKVPSDRSQE